MTRNKINFTLFLALALFASLTVFAQESAAPKKRIPGQFAQDFVAGNVPSLEEVAAVEKEIAADPNNFELVRKLGKGYFFQFFGEGNNSYAPKSIKTFERALELKKDDPETLAYLGAIYGLIAERLDKKDPAKQKAGYDKSFEFLKKAEQLAPRNGAVISVTSIGYLDLPDSYGMAPHVIQQIEGMRKAMGPMFDRFSHHGRQRLLLTLGRAYAKTSQAEKARGLFEEALKINQESVEASLLKAELKKLSAAKTD